MEINDIVERFNNGDLAVEKYFNDYDTFFKFLKRRGVMSDIDPRNASDSEKWQNEYLIWLRDNDLEKFNYWIHEFLDDVEFKDDQPILSINDRGDLSKLFYENEISNETIRNLLSSDSDFFEYYSNTTSDIYRDVIEELNPKNKKRLCEYIVEVLKDHEISPETDELELIAEEQGHPEYVKITSENVQRIVDDEESMNELLDNELDDLSVELFSIHNNSYNSAYESTFWDYIWSSLGKYFIGDGIWVSRPHTYKKNTQVQIFQIPIANFYSNVIDYLKSNKDYGNTGTLEYIGSYIGMLVESGDLIRLYTPDYPDSDKVDAAINDYFSDFI